MSWTDRLLFWRHRTTAGEQRFTLDDYLGLLNTFTWNGVGYATPGVRQTLAGNVEPAPQGFSGLVESTHGTNAVVFACMAVRQLVFSAVRFQWQQLQDGRPSKLFGTPALSLLETPWAGGTTQDLLNRMIQDADLAGNNYLTRDTPLPRLGGDGGAQLVRLRPDWVEVVLEERMLRGAPVGYRKAGYLYTEDGPNSGNDPAVFGPEELTHFAPYPDPLASYRGMSWLTPVIREVQADQLMTKHKRKFFENGATPNMIIRYPLEANEDKIKRLKAVLDIEHGGVDNAYKRLHVGGGADVTVVGVDLQKMTFKEVQGAGETRIAAAAGTPPVIVGLSEGLQGSSLNAGNYGMARRRFADATMHPLWQNVAGSLQLIVGPLPPGGAVRLWYDARDVPFLREDEKDAAEIQLLRAQTLRQYVDSGWTPESSQASMLAGDEGLLTHSGLYSVQLQPAGQTAPTPSPNGNGGKPSALVGQ